MLTSFALAVWLAAAPAWQAPAPQTTGIIRGVVVDAKTKAPLADVRVRLVEAGLTTQTTSEGRFEFPPVAAGKHTVSITTIGYIFVKRPTEVVAGQVQELAVPLAEGTGTYQETVSVSADVAPPAAAGVSSRSELGSAAIQDLRGVLADDPMRAVQALPGVATGDDFQAQFSVRGSAFRQVGVVIDGTATLMLLHSIRGVNDSGSVAMINSDVLDHASLMAGAHPQQHGDWTGATLLFDLREGSRDRNQVRIALSGTNSALVVEGPLGRGRRGSWIASIRRSYLDWLIRKIEPDVDSTIGFSDLQAKFTFDISMRQRLELTVVGGRSVYHDFKPGATNGVADGLSKSALASVGWQFARNNLFLRQRVSISTNTFENNGVQGQDLGDGDIQSKAWRADVTWLQSKTLTFDAGAKVDAQHDSRLLRHYVNAGGGRIRVGTTLDTEGSTRLASVWGQAAYRRGGTSVVGGVRSTSDSLSGTTVASPWLLAEQTLGRFTLRASTGAAHQFPDLEMLPLTTPRAAERARFADLGIEHRLTDSLRWQLTAFARQDDDVFRQLGEPRLVNNVLVTETTFPSFAGTLGGRTRGVDLLVARRAATGLTGWVGYTYSHTHYRDRITGEEFDGDFDQRHTLNVFALQRLGYRTSVNAKLRVGSNFPVVGYFGGNVDALTVGSVRNAVRLPVYARLDLRASRTFTFDRRRVTLFFEIMNATGRHNLGQFDGTVRSNFTADGYIERMIPRVPSAGILIEF